MIVYIVFATFEEGDSVIKCFDTYYKAHSYIQSMHATSQYVIIDGEEFANDDYYDPRCMFVEEHEVN